MRAFILAAGYATRLYPLTRDRPKPLLEIGGKPLLTHLVERLAPLRDLREIVVVGNARFEAQYQAWAGRTPTPAPIRVLNDGSTEEGNRLGAIADLAFALDRTPEGDDMIVAAGDNLIEFELRPFQETFLERRRPLLLVRPVEDAADQGRYNEVTLDPAGRVVAFREKPADRRSSLAAIALYFFPADVAPLVRRYLEGGKNPDAPGYFLEWLVGQRPVEAARFEGAWHDIGSLQSLAAAQAGHKAAASGLWNG